MAEYLVQDTSLKQVADAIRRKTGSINNLEFPQGMIEAIATIEGGESPSLPPVDGIFYINHGSFTPAEAVKEYNIFTIEELRNIASQNTIYEVSYFSLIVRIKNINHASPCPAVLYVTFWVNSSRGLQDVNSIGVYFRKNLSRTLFKQSATEAKISEDTGLTLDSGATNSNNYFAATEYVWTLIGYTGV